MNDTAPTAEEGRAELEIPQTILRRSGFAAAAPLFSADLASATDLAEATRVVTSHGRRLWTEAIRQDSPDDRPLYWARLGLTARLRGWQPTFELGGDDFRTLLRRLEHAARGHDDLVFPPDDRLLRVIVTGFDPYRLDEDLRRSNPTGAAALDLNGATFDIGEHTAVVRTAIFPVRWRDLTDGIVERALLSQYTATAAAADAVITLSEGDSDDFVLVSHACPWRDDAVDNERVRAPGATPLDQAPYPRTQPQWSPSTLPRRSIVEQGSGRFVVRENTEITEIPPGREEAEVTARGPTPGSRARAGGAGAGFANEVTYRNTRLRAATQRTIPAGHVITPALRPPPEGSEDTVALDGTSLERDRTDILDQLRAIVTAALTV
ncbi:pyroglutamyl peptidase [Halostreptopolyspora alba]|uniref:Pyroglutamyl peptidase n=1 Tax=Halostreptopolyspora alba TaxID=2487137 RepID=A0A3N0EG41_9ACTN|nr:pyroglutamyl peptidase [Nocardiopsaceae bacterium YIM 96095]